MLVKCSTIELHSSEVLKSFLWYLSHRNADVTNTPSQKIIRVCRGVQQQFLQITNTKESRREDIYNQLVNVKDYFKELQGSVSPEVPKEEGNQPFILRS
ncbi:mCG1035306, isoform CRA_a [Mus musculus]|jgi:hypothetical protein|nr:mCG1035306, isoform CRA_a [Mus musculus]EDL26261.1 mCG1035306, isoform CRA_a [Mus musculus]